MYNNYLGKNNTWHEIPSKEIKSEFKNKGKKRSFYGFRKKGWRE